MALKADREIYVTDIHCVANATGEAGQLAIYDTQGTGQGSGQGLNANAPRVTVQGTGTPASGTKVAGLLLCNVVNVYGYQLLADGTPASGLTAGIGDPANVTAHRNYGKTDQVIYEPVPLLKRGVVWTNMVAGTPAPGAAAYLAANSKASTTQANSIPQVGEFRTAQTSDGYCKLAINLI